MRTKYMLSVMAIVAITKSAYAQYSQDAIRFSTSQPGSTARIKAIGNATTAIGGDLSSVSGNPAGIGFFTKSELSFTPEFNGFSANTNYLGTANNSTSTNLNFNNASGVIYSRLNTPRGASKEDGWLSFNVGGSYNRTNDFYQTINYSGSNTNNSISTYYADLAIAAGNNATIGGPNLQDWAYTHNLIDKYAAATPLGYTFKSNVFSTTAIPVGQNNSIIREGGQTEFSFAAGANYSNKFYLGFGIGITSVRYNSTNTFNETGTASVYNGVGYTNSNFNSAYTQQQITTGSGFNMRGGFIYKPDPAVRFGATITTPTWYTIDDDYSEKLSTQYKTGVVSTYNNGPADYQLTYNFRTPWKVSGGLAVFVNESGFITGDVEYLDYSSVKIDDADGYAAGQDNRDIKSLYRSTVNYHLGAEYKISQVYLRGGYGVQASPLRTNGNNINTISGGLGYRVGTYYIDATYANVQGTQNIYPYVTSSNSPIAAASQTNNNIFVTFGMRF